ncbi:excinuclease ABC subunit UvrC [Geobacter sp. FeAm09]|uniref:excinuclease ABC subunit UvrC n=1 Tax=Geobacter sp. FeAm09 TaxID=2597769 RepID=UPI0011F06531|nr:excinuclease ABC subunit UvrC [Geobacter sp. FeAm09]QEM66947.1 excinuclease ABC subunit UvrC [Geobacter sp. FeAm09]
MSLEDKIRQLPTSPGVYLMRDGKGAIIYIGKARNLRQRVRTYFGATGDGRYHVKFLVAKVADIEVMLTDTEKEALLLENTLIKQHHPRYNLDLKDDKTYFSLRLDPREEFPRFSIVRKVPRDGARYFGPYASASAAREVLRQITRMFPLRHYPLKACMARKRPCLYHQIGQCSAPCHGLISAADYAALAEGAALFLEGKSKQLVTEFRRRMAEAAEALRYEEAARWRNLLRSIEVTVEKQKVVMRGGGDSDVVGYFRDGTRLEVALLFIRGGVLSGSRLFSLTWELDDAEGVASFLHQFYGGETFIPEEILLPLEIEEAGALAELLGEARGKKVAIARPVRGLKRELVDLAGKNAAAALRERDEAAASAEAVLEELRQRLHLTRLPHRIECYDISTIQGRHSVGSGVAFTDARPDKARYRRYRIRDVQGQDDFAMLAEVFSRRFREEKVAEAGLPDLVVVDGGIGQLNAAQEIVAGLGLTGRFDLVSLAKSRTARDAAAATISKSDERVFLPGRKNPVVLRQNSAPLLLLAAIRDEAHRFAIGYHRTLRGKEGTASGIEQIPGIGAKRRTALLRHFGSLQRLKEASVEEIAAVAGMNPTIAATVFAGLHGEDPPND